LPLLPLSSTFSLFLSRPLSPADEYNLMSSYAGQVSDNLQHAADILEIDRKVSQDKVTEQERLLFNREKEVENKQNEIRKSKENEELEIFYRRKNSESEIRDSQGRSRSFDRGSNSSALGYEKGRESGSSERGMRDSGGERGGGGGMERERERDTEREGGGTQYPPRPVQQRIEEVEDEDDVDWENEISYDNYNKSSTDNANFINSNIMNKNNNNNKNNNKNNNNNNINARIEKVESVDDYSISYDLDQFRHSDDFAKTLPLKKLTSTSATTSFSASLDFPRKNSWRDSGGNFSAKKSKQQQIIESDYSDVFEDIDDEFETEKDSENERNKSNFRQYNNDNNNNNNKINDNNNNNNNNRNKPVITGGSIEASIEEDYPAYPASPLKSNSKFPKSNKLESSMLSASVTYDDDFQTSYGQGSSVEKLKKSDLSQINENNNSPPKKKIQNQFQNQNQNQNNQKNRKGDINTSSNINNNNDANYSSDSSESQNNDDDEISSFNKSNFIPGGVRSASLSPAEFLAMNKREFSSSSRNQDPRSRSPGGRKFRRFAPKTCSHVFLF
jgi:hypothetical protein